MSETNINLDNTKLTTNIIQDTYANPNPVKMREGKKKESDTETSTSDAKVSMLNTINVLNFKGQANNKDFIYDSSSFFDGINPNDLRNPTGTALFKNFDGSKHSAIYRPEDFIFLTDYGNLPNNHLLTLRRFPNPCRDDIYNKELQSLPDVGRLLGYIDGEVNKIEDIFSFSPGFNWKDFKSDIQTIDNKSKGGGKGIFNTIGKYTDRKGTTVKENMQGEARTNFDPYNDHRDNYTWGPIDVIDTINTRERGLKFEHTLKITFDYTVRSYGGITTKMVFLDIIGNILNICTNKAPFWGGATRFTGATNYGASLLGDMNKLNKGDIGGFIKDMIGNFKNAIIDPFKNNPIESLKGLAANIGSGLLGGQLDKLGRPELYSIKALLEGVPTGEWHLTVGNPFKPTLMIGNLTLQDAKIIPFGPFTVDDVPSQVKVELTLNHGMPRDKFSIQSMFNEGKGRYYSSDIDFEKRQYYRNRDAGGTGGNIPANKVFDKTVSSATDLGVSTVDYAKAAFKTF
jgi:hypothetical protein